MPIEAEMLADRPPAKLICTHCGAPGPTFMRGQVQSWWRCLLRRPYCAVICNGCRKLVGWEKP
jgi:hypothetical protein